MNSIEYAHENSFDITGIKPCGKTVINQIQQFVWVKKMTPLKLEVPILFLLISNRPNNLTHIDILKTYVKISVYLE